MTDSQRIFFNEKLNELFNAIEKEMNGEKIENKEKIESWGRNLYTRYKYAITNTNPKYALAQEHMEVFKQKLKEQNITEKEFEKSLGSIKNLAIIKKEKQTKKEYTIEELKNRRSELDKIINDLKQKQTSKYKQLYKPTQEETNKIEKDLEKYSVERRQINEMIDKKNEKTNKQNIDDKEIKKKQAYNEKINNLMQKIYDQGNEIKELEDTIAYLKKQENKWNSKYQQKYEKKLLEETKKLKEEYETKIKNENQIVESKNIKQLQETIKKLEDEKQSLEKEIERLKSLLKLETKKTNERQKEIILKLMCSKDDITLDEIRSALEKNRIPFDGFKDTLNELKSEIPGLNKRITPDGRQFSYSITTPATTELDEYKKCIVSPSICSLIDGEIKFIVRSDTHLNIKSSEDTLNRFLYPYMEYCSKNGNIPVIDLGDISETIRYTNIENWKNMDKETIKYAYQFYKNYAKVISNAPEIENYILLGNHDEHPFWVGVDPLQIMKDYSDNIISLGVSKGEFRISNDKIAVYHDKEWQNIVSYKEYSKSERDSIIYDFLCEKMQELSKDYTYSLIGHYHFGKINPDQNFAVINNGIGNPLLITAIIKNGRIEKMYMSELNNNGKILVKSNYETEIYNIKKAK